MFKIIEKANLALLLVFLMACSTIENRPNVKKEFEGIHPELSKYVDDFLMIVGPHYDKSRLDNMSAGKKPIGEGTIVGLCKFFGMGKKVEIVIDSPFWKNADKYEKEVLMLHELGHCLCGLDHVHLEGKYDRNFLPFMADNDTEVLSNGFLDDGCPASIMHPSVLPSVCYRKHRSFYRHNLRIQCYASKLYQRNSFNSEKADTKLNLCRF